MKRRTAVVLYVLPIAVVVICVDVFFFRDQPTWERLLANAGIVAVFLAAYLAFAKRR